MSEIQRDLLKSTFSQKRIIGVVIIAGLLIAMFAFSTALINLLLGTEKLTPNNQLAEAEFEDVELMLPPFPFNISWFMDLFSDLNLTEEEMADLLDTLFDMFDGEIDELNLSDYAMAIAALLLSEEEVFRIYDFRSLSEISERLWRYECFDEYTGDSWKSSAIKDVYSFYSYGDYNDYHPDSDMLRIKMPLTPSQGVNSFVAPSLFPIPFIMEDSVQAPNLDDSSTVLYKDDFNCSVLSLNFYFEGNIDMSYEFFGLNLPTGEEINSTAKDEDFTPVEIKDQYLQLPPSLSVYKANNPNFNSHWNYLNDNVIKDEDNAFIVADKIRNYLQYNFDFPVDPADYNPAPEGADTVEWFCQTEQGVWSDFASAFCVFSRSFGVASRFVDGFNSRNVNKQYDDEEGEDTIIIKYKNIYSWAEIYVPTDVSGGGEWVQMDVYYDSFVGNAPSTHDYEIVVSSNFTSGYRGQVANITATLSSDTGSVVDQSISFTDLTTGQDHGSNTTNARGETSILIDIDNNQIVGPHNISAVYNPQTYNFTQYVVFGDVEVHLTSVNPTEVNVSKPVHDTNVQGYVYDPIYNSKVKGATVDFILFINGTETKVPNSFTPNFTNTDENGDFNEVLTVNINTPPGFYEIRADFNGSWNNVGLAVGYMNDSSDRVEFNVTEALQYNIDLYINGTPSNFPNPPNLFNLFFAKRYQNLNISVNVTFAKDNTPAQGVTVEFYKYVSGGDISIGTDVSNSQGNASILWQIGDSIAAGPNLIYARVLNKYNYSYFILNETIIFDPLTLTGPTPPIINRTESGPQFNIGFNLTDLLTNGIGYAEINLKMYNESGDYSYMLNPIDPNEFFDITGSNEFDINMRVQPDTQLGNYTLILVFNGTFDYTHDSMNPYPVLFELPELNCSSILIVNLSVEDPSIFIFDFFINGTCTNDFTINRNGHLNLSVYLQWGKDLINDGEKVYFYDITNETYIGEASLMDGWANITYITDSNTVAGPHLVCVNYSKDGTWQINYSYFILNAPINISLFSGPDPHTINRSGPYDTQFIVYGKLIDGDTGAPIKFGQIEVFLYDGIDDVSYYLEEGSGTYPQQDNNKYHCNETGQFYFVFDVDDFATPQKNFSLKINFSGIISYVGLNLVGLNLVSFNVEDEKTFDFLSVIDPINFTDSVDGIYELKVKNPEDIVILLYINGNASIEDYTNINKPLICKRGEIINFTVYVNQSGSYAIGLVTIFDVYTNSPLNSTNLNAYDYGNYSFLVDTSFWHAGLHFIIANFSGKVTINATYIIINESISISIYQASNFNVMRNETSFTISGRLNCSQYGNYSRGLGVRILLLENGTLNDYSQFLITQGSQQILPINDDGTFSFKDVKINISCPSGSYLIRIDFNGSIQHYDMQFSVVDLINSMVSSSSSLIALNVTANCSLVGYFYMELIPDRWINGDTCHIVGNLTWDNNTRMGGVIVNATVKNGAIILSTNSSVTNPQGEFDITFTVGEGGEWDDEITQIFISFYPEETYTSPEHYFIQRYENIEIFWLY